MGSEMAGGDADGCFSETDSRSVFGTTLGVPEMPVGWLGRMTVEDFGVTSFSFSPVDELIKEGDLVGSGRARLLDLARLFPSSFDTENKDDMGGNGNGLAGVGWLGDSGASGW